MHLGALLLVRQHPSGGHTTTPLLHLQASECSAMKHCIKAVWEKQAVPQDDDEVPFLSFFDKIYYN